MSNELDLARGVYRAFAAGDIPAVLADVFMKLGAEWEGFAAVPEEFVDAGETVVALGEYSGTCIATGKHFKAPFAHVWKFRDGKAVSFHQHTDTAMQLAAMQP